MPKTYKSKYQSDWEKSYNWLQKCVNDFTKAKCKICGSSFRIDGSGLGQVKSHAKSQKHITTTDILAGNSQQSRFDTDSNSGAYQLSKGRLMLSNDDKVLKAEIAWALKCVQSNFSFSSNTDNSSLFKFMFPDSDIAKHYQMAETKCKYLIQFGIHEWVKEDLLIDMKASPFSYKFDETTTSQLKKQYDAYVQYNSQRFKRIVNRYCGSLFLGHCKANDLVKHFFEFGKTMAWDIDFLIQIGMDGPEVNLSFGRKLTGILKEEYKKTIVDIGTCALHKVHNGFEKCLKVMSFDFNGFAYNLWYFFKNSSARREDYKLMELLTEHTEAEFMIKHVSSRWLSLKKVLTRIIEQWENLKTYFLQFLPKEKNFVKEIESTNRYQSIRKYLVSSTSVLYMSFALYIAESLTEFIILFQSSKPLVHVLYPAIGDLLFNLMTNFVNQKVLVDEKGKQKDAKELGCIKLNEKGILKSIHEMNFGHKATYQIGLIENNSKIDIVKIEFKKSYVALTEYLQNNLPHNYSILADLQYIHPSKCHHEKGVPAMRRVAEKMFSVLRGASFTNLTIDSYVDMIVREFQLYQMETLDHLKDITTYTYWCKIGEIMNLQQQPKYLELVKLIKACLCLSHGNVDPERGFSENKNILQGRESLDGDTINALRSANDFIKLYGKIEDIPFTRRILDLCGNARLKYFAFLDLKKEEEKLSLANKREAEVRLEAEKTRKTAIEKVLEIDTKIQMEDQKLVAAEVLIEDSNKSLVKTINSGGKINKADLIKAQMILNAGIEKVAESKSRISDLEKEKSSILAKNKKA